MEGGAELYLGMCCTLGSEFITEQAELLYTLEALIVVLKPCQMYTIIIFAVRPHPLMSFT